MTNPIEDLFLEAYVLDTETTSLDFKEAEVIQFAGDSAMSILEKLAVEDYDNAVPVQFYTPDTPITPKISSITTITNRMVAGSPRFKDEMKQVESEINKHRYIIAHNAYYDEGVLGKAHGLKLPNSICTMRFAKKLYKDDTNISEYNLSFLRYALDLPIPDDIPAHLANADVMVTTLLFAKLVEDAISQNILDLEAGELGEQLVSWLDKPVIITIMPFGKHKGKKLTEVPVDYWMWALDNFNSLNEEDSAYDKDFAASVTKAIEVILGD